MSEEIKYHFQKAPYMGFVAENNCCHLHMHRQVEISYITRGEQTFIIDNVSYPLKAGDLVLVFPNQAHRLITPSYCKAITSIFDPNLTSDYTTQLTRFHMDNCIFHKEELSESTLAALNELARTGISKSYKQHAVPYTEKGFLSVILAELMLLHTLIPYEPTDSPFILTQFFNYIELHLDKDLSLKAVSEALSISASRLSATISNNTGMSLHALINTRRLDYSRNLLTKTDLPVSEVAQRCGFASERSFYRNFKNMYQKTPIEFRIKKTTAKT